MSVYSCQTLEEVLLPISPSSITVFSAGVMSIVTVAKADMDLHKVPVENQSNPSKYSDLSVVVGETYPPQATSLGPSASVTQ